MEDAPYIEQMAIRDFRCIKDVDLLLTRLHAFVGPNDSGKSTLLRAVARIPTVGWELLSAENEGHRPVSPITLRWRADGASTSWRERGASGLAWVGGPAVAPEKTYGAWHQKVSVLRLDPDELRRPTQLLVAGSPIAFQSERGLGLAAVYDAIQSRNLDAFLAIRQRFLARFPPVRELGQANASATEKVMQIVLADGSEVRASDMSEGMLYWLAFEALAAVDPISVLLVEEPENGLHPHRIQEVMAILRELSQRTQVLIATHSPLILNELTPDEISVVTRSPARGTVVTPLRQTRDFEVRSRVYSPGELWLAYANGLDEAELVGSAAP